MATMPDQAQQQYQHTPDYDDSFLRQLGISPMPQQQFPPPSHVQPHPFAHMSFNPEDDLSDDDQSDDDYVDAEESFSSLPGPSAPPQVPLHSRPAQPAFPNKSQPQPLLSQSTSQSHLVPPIANAQHKGHQISRPIILPTPAPTVQKAARSRPARKGGASANPPLVASARPSNVKRAGAPTHRATLSVSSGSGPVDVIDPAIPDPNEEGIIMLNPAQTYHLRFIDFDDNMFLARKEFTDPMYPSHLEPPSKLSPLRCLCCKKQYNGPNARSMWRRHITQKHHFQLGGKKGNGKGKKGEDDDENTLPDEAIEESAALRREAILEQKREYARNRRIQERMSANGRPLLAQTPSLVDVNKTLLNGNTQWYGPQSLVLNGVWPTALATSTASRGDIVPGNFLMPQSSASRLLVPPPPPQQIVVTDADDDQPVDGNNEEDEEDELPFPLESQGHQQMSSSSSRSTLQSSLLAPSPVLDSPDPGSFSALPFSSALSLQQSPRQAEPQLVQNEEELKPDASQPSGLNGRQAVDFDIDLGALRPDYLATSPVLSNMQHDSTSFLSTPGRSGGDDLTEVERRRIILSLESPTSFPLLKRSQSIAGLADSPTGSRVARADGSSLKVPTRHGGLLSTPGLNRSRTMPAAALGGLTSSPLGEFSQLLRSTPGRPSDASSISASMFDFFAASPGYRSWGMNTNTESPVVKRKRSVTDIPNHALSFVPWKDDDKDDVDDGLFKADGTLDPTAFDSWFDYTPKSPAKKARSEDGGDDGRMAKKARVSI